MHEDSPVREERKEKREPRIETTIRTEGGSLKEVHKKLERAVRRHKGGRKMARKSRR